MIPGLTDEEKRRAVTERSQMAAEYGSDFESIQKYCIEKIIKRNSSVNSSIIGKVQCSKSYSTFYFSLNPGKDDEILLQISLNLCKIDHSYLKNYTKLHNAASRLKDQFKESFRDTDHSD